MATTCDDLTHVEVGDTLGAALIGGILTAMLFGITVLQTFIYYQRFERDPKELKTFVGLVFLSDTAHMILVIHSLYWYMIINYVNPSSLALIPSSIFGGICVTNISDTAIRYFFMRRVWILSHRNYLLTAPLFILISLIFISGFSFGVKGFSLPTFVQLSTISWLLYLGFAMAVTGDFYIACSLCILLYRSRSGLKSTNSLVNTLIGYSVNTGLITSVTSTVCLFTYVAMPTNFVFLATYFPLSKLYVNAMLATLNCRDYLRNTDFGVPVSSLVAYMPSSEINTDGENRTQSQGRTSYPLRAVGQSSTSSTSTQKVELNSKSNPENSVHEVFVTKRLQGDVDTANELQDV